MLTFYGPLINLGEALHCNASPRINWGVTIWIFLQLMPLCCKANILNFPLSWLPGDHCAALPIVDRQCSSTKLWFANTLLLLPKHGLHFPLSWLTCLMPANQNHFLLGWKQPFDWLNLKKKVISDWLKGYRKWFWLAGIKQTKQTWLTIVNFCANFVTLCEISKSCGYKRLN